jgi:hypothetical protein
MFAVSPLTNLRRSPVIDRLALQYFLKHADVGFLLDGRAEAPNRVRRFPPSNGRHLFWVANLYEPYACHTVKMNGSRVDFSDRVDVPDSYLGRFPAAGIPAFQIALGLVTNADHFLTDVEHFIPLYG